MIKIAIDEDISRITGRLLKNSGYEVLDIRDHNLRGSTDDIIFHFAVENEAVLLTGDMGFANILKYPLNTHSGIIVLHFPTQISNTEINNQLIAALDSMSESEFPGNLIILEPNKIRIKRDINIV